MTHAIIFKVVSWVLSKSFFDLIWGQKSLQVFSNIHKLDFDSIIELRKTNVPPAPKAVEQAIQDYLWPKNKGFNLIRVGGYRNGAYLCPDDLSGIDTCYSPGCSRRKSFEDDILEKWGIQSQMIDKSSDPDQFTTSLVPGKQVFNSLWLDLDQTDFTTITLDKWVEKNSPNKTDDLMLQIDIEHAEYRNILAARPETLRRFRIICMKLHGLNFLCNDRTFFEYAFLPMLQKLNQNHYCAHLTSNNACGSWSINDTQSFPSLVEVTYHRRDRVITSDEMRSPTPHPLDVMNAAHKPPLHINTRLDASDNQGPTALLEEVAILKQELRDLKYQFRQLSSRVGFNLSNEHKEAYNFYNKNDLYI